ncbi:Hypothetical predicted protein [Mytilus galloprovincialis]|uniref:Uncharacterized protein n=1 Tax=Mytilus galloprovincialis TaxID=29158 RepID=A0A8B6C006_MYTGA|nr:Hypothetical predicted protein [Mytilus galloprovincialis]
MSEPKEKPKLKNRTIDEMFKKIRESESPEIQNETPKVSMRISESDENEETGVMAESQTDLGEALTTTSDLTPSTCSSCSDFTLSLISKYEPPYPDIAKLSDMDDLIKQKLLSTKWNDSHLFKFPSRCLDKAEKTSKFLASKSSMDALFDIIDALYCAYCCFSHQKTVKKSRLKTPVSDWKNLPLIVKGTRAQPNQMCSN